MNTTLTLDVFSGFNKDQEPIDFFNTDQWTTETEAMLMQHVRDVLAIIRPMGKALHLHFNVEVTDALAAVFMINKQKDKRPVNTHKLTGRQAEILGLVMQGYTNYEIAQKLFISIETVRTHRKHVLVKTKAKNTVSLLNHYYHTLSGNQVRLSSQS